MRLYNRGCVWRKNPGAVALSASERQLGGSVNVLYGLTPEEIKPVEGQTK